MQPGNLWILVLVLACNLLIDHRGSCAQTNLQTTWPGGWQIAPTTLTPWSIHARIPMTTSSLVDYEDEGEARKAKKKRKNSKGKKRLKKFMLPLLIAYKLKFFTLIPVVIMGLLLLTGATGLAGFFFALFAATMGLTKSH